MDFHAAHPLSVRTLFVVTMVAFGLYVGAIGGYTMFELSPATAALQSRTTQLAAEYDSIRARSNLLRDAVAEVQHLSLARSLTPEQQQRVRTLRAALGQVAEQSAGVQANLLLHEPAALRVALAEAGGAESGVAGSLVVALGYLRVGDFDAASREMLRAGIARDLLVTRLDTAQRLGLANLAGGQRELGARAGRITTAIEIWLVLGAVALGLITLVAHRRVYQPMAMLDAGLARVAMGDLHASLPITRNDEFGRLVATFNEMTEVLRTRTEVEALRQSESRFRALIEQAPTAIFVSRDGVGLYANHAWSQLFGFKSSEEIIGRPLLDFYAPQCREERRARFQRLHAGLLPVPDEFESTGLRADGSQFFMQVSNSPTVLPDGRATLSFVTDISNRRAAEEALRTSESQHRAILQTAMNGYWRVSPAGQLLEVNEAYCRMSGYTEQELVGMQVTDLDANESEAAAISRREKLMAMGQDRFEARHRRKDGSLFDVEVSVTYQPEDGTGMVGFLQDITERKAAEALLQRLLRDKEALLKEVHHRVKNNLQLIASLLHLESARSTEAETKAALAGMHGRLRSIARLHESLTHTESHSSIDLGAYLTGLTNEIVSALVTSPTTIRLRSDLASVHVAMDRAMPCGLLVNELVTNAIKHGFPDGRTGEVQVELHSVGDGSELRLRVSDDGADLPADILLKQETSLGLQLVSDLVKQLQGTLEIGPPPRAAFTVTFPANHSA